MDVKIRNSDHAYFCKKCLNREMDMKQGMLCSIIGEKAVFEGTCPNFKEDKNIRNELHNDNTLLPEVENYEKRFYIDFIDDTPRPRDLPKDQKIGFGIDEMIGHVKIGLNPDEIEKYLSPEVIEKLRKEQDLKKGIISGLTVGILSAMMVGTISLFGFVEIPIMATPLIGAVVGLTVRKEGKGIDKIFGIWGGVISLFSILLAILFSYIIFSFIVLEVNKEILLLEKLTSKTLDLGFYLFLNLIALYILISTILVGYKLSFRVVTKKKIEELKPKDKSPTPTPTSE